jgi:hypothetical protein
VRHVSEASIPSQAQLFNDILETTDSPALALQAYTGNVIRMMYYIWLPIFDVPGEALTTYWGQRQIPGAGWGFWSVMVILSVHTVACVTVDIFLITCTRYSLLGNAWAALAQVASMEDAQAMMSDGTLRPDREVARMVKGAGTDNALYKVQTSVQDDGVRLRTFFREVGGDQADEEDSYPLVTRRGQAAGREMTD